MWAGCELHLDFTWQGARLFWMTLTQSFNWLYPNGTELGGVYEVAYTLGRLSINVMSEQIVPVYLLSSDEVTDGSAIKR